MVLGCSLCRMGINVDEDEVKKLKKGIDDEDEEEINR